MESILEVKGVAKYFLPPLSLGRLIKFDFKKRRPAQALIDVSFSLERAKILGILGPNGAGKTTLLKIISTLILPNQGTVTVNGYPLGKDDKKIKSCIGLATEEERSFYWRLSGRQNLEFFAALYGFNRKGMKTRIDELLELFKVDYADRRFDAYSTGMKRRFALIRALLHNPDLLLLDEPTRSLDYTSSFNLRNFIKDNLVKTQGKTVIFTTHQMEEALDFADLFLILHKGRLCALGTLDELRKKVNHPEATLGEIFLKLTGEY